MGCRLGNYSPNYPQSNGHAEVAVAAMKDLVAQISPTGDLTSEEFTRGMLEFRNTPRENGLSPAKIVFGHPLRSIIPAHRTSYAGRWQAVMEGRDRQADLDDKVQLRYDERTHPLAPLSIGAHVCVRDAKFKLWDRVGVD